MKREKIRQVFKQRFEDFDADNNYVTKFVITRCNGLWHVKLKCTVKQGESRIKLTQTIINDIIDRCVWVGDYFYCTTNYRANESYLYECYIYISFHPLNDIN
jgi:hypothetical protein